MKSFVDGRADGVQDSEGTEIQLVMSTMEKMTIISSTGESYQSQEATPGVEETWGQRSSAKCTTVTAAAAVAMMIVS